MHTTRILAGCLALACGFGAGTRAAAPAARAPAPPRRTATLAYGPKKTALPLTVVFPADYERTTNCPVMIALPPGPGTAEMVEANLGFWAAETHRRGHLLVCPQILGPRLQVEADDVLQSVFEWLDRNARYDRTRVSVTGASNGGVGALLAAVAGANRFHSVIGFPGAYAGNLQDLGGLKDRPVWLLAGEKDPMWKAGAQATVSALNKAGARAKLDVLPGQGHMLRIEPKRLLDWIEKQPPLPRATNSPAASLPPGTTRSEPVSR